MWYKNKSRLLFTPDLRGSLEHSFPTNRSNDIAKVGKEVATPDTASGERQNDKKLVFIYTLGQHYKIWRENPNKCKYNTVFKREGVINNYMLQL